MQGRGQPHRKDRARGPAKPSGRVALEATGGRSRGDPAGSGRSPRWDPPLPLAPRFAKYYKTENGSEYRTLLKAFGIRFDVLVYGNVSPCAGRTSGQGRNPRPVPGPEEALSWSHLPAPHLAPHLCCEGAGPAASPFPLHCPSGWESKFDPWPPGLPDPGPLASVFVHTGWQVQHHPHHHQLRGSLHLRGSGEFSPSRL